MIDTRKETIILVARQVALTHGYNWQIAPNAMQAKKQREYITYAEGIVRTIERKMASWSWPKTIEQANAAE